MAKGQPDTKSELTVREKMMRFAILTLAILGTLAGGFLGMKWISDADKVKEATKLLQSLGGSDSPEVKSAIASANSTVTAAYLMVCGALIAVPAAIVAWKMPAYAKIAGIVLITAAGVPAFFAAKSLIFTFFFVLAGGLCLLVKSPATVNANATIYRQPAMAAA